jgi:two-component sensor histidine kinase
MDRMPTASRAINPHVIGRMRLCASLLRQYGRAFPALPHQVRQARTFLASLLADCPAADDAILCLSELASNCILHSASQLPGGTFTVGVEIREGAYVLIEVHDNGGPWHRHSHCDDRPHGLNIVASVAAESGVCGNAVTGWISWARIDWYGARPTS